MEMAIVALSLVALAALGLCLYTSRHEGMTTDRWGRWMEANADRQDRMLRDFAGRMLAISDAELDRMKIANEPNGDPAPRAHMPDNLDIVTPNMIDNIVAQTLETRPGRQG